MLQDRTLQQGVTAEPGGEHAVGGAARRTRARRRGGDLGGVRHRLMVVDLPVE